MKKRVVYLIEQPLDERNYQRFGIQAWLDRQWATEVWDLTPWAHPRAWEDFRAMGRQLAQFAGYFPIESRRALSQRLSSTHEIGYFIDLTGENYYTVQAKWGLRRRGAVHVICASGSIPMPPRSTDTGFARLAKILAKGPRRSLNWFSDSFFHRVVRPRLNADLAVLSGESSVGLARNCRASIAAHNFDYDIYLRLSESTEPTSQRYAVFLDQDYCYHPEFTQRGNSPVVTEQRYFPAVRAALAAISASLEMTVRVAAHPRATYTRRGEDYFGSWPIEYGQTAELVKNCAVVVAHDSTAIQFAVLFNKPVIFLTTDELQQAYEGRSIVQVASELGKRPINPDGEDPRAVNWRQELRIDERRYSDYRRKYIKMRDTPEMPLWDIVISHIESANT